MARKKVKLAFIENATSRKATSSKRTKGLVKKTQELSVLCDIDACAIIFAKDAQVPVVWPSSEAEIKRIISNYRDNSDMYQLQRQLDQQSLSEVNVIKTEEKVERIQRKNRDLQIENMVTDIMTGKSTIEQVDPCDLSDLILVLENRMKSVQHRLKVFGKNSNPRSQGDRTMEASTSGANHTSQ
ncbi:agamous-like MADS-box protein AGL80 [Chenopodium quinoa]|uniref:MADS-box domain-containing protein n=1 Tax=Chenopodium quinoa TaxID=63459 RepID=A0A803M5E2_CHEQI|nr:agamous-like MADS-box protein AGL80 [Chenopodium quinoa]